MKNSLMFAGAMFAALGTIYAQADESLDRQVDVTRDYRPTVESATKLSVQPNMTDTVQLRPDFEYTVKPTPINHGFGVTAISPVSVNATTYQPLYPFYLKVGGGFPGQSLADLYYNSTGRGNGSFGFYLNHDGRYNKIESDLGFKNKAMRTRNSAGINGMVKVGQKVSLSGELGFDYDIYSRYGEFDQRIEVPGQKFKVVQQKFMTPRGNFRIGNDFTDLSRLNFAVSGSAYYFKDDFSNAETGVELALELAKSTGMGELSVEAGYDASFGNDKLDNQKGHTFNLAPNYGFKTDDLKMGLGVNFIFDTNGDENDFAFLPSFDLEFIKNPAFVPFVNVESRMIHSTYRNLTSLNPYLNENSPFADNAYRYDLRAGFSGTVANVFTYKLYGGAGYIKNAVNFANLYEESGNSSTFVMFGEKRTIEYMIGAQFDVRLASSFSAMLGGRYTGYDTKTFDEAINLPDYQVGLKLKWNHRDRFFATAGLDLIGARKFLECRVQPGGVEDLMTIVDQKAVLDLSLGLEYRLKNELGIFVEGSNLTGSKLYRFNHYPEKGPVVSAGVKLLF